MEEPSVRQQRSHKAYTRGKARARDTGKSRKRGICIKEFYSTCQMSSSLSLKHIDGIAASALRDVSGRKRAPATHALKIGQVLERRLGGGLVIDRGRNVLRQASCQGCIAPRDRQVALTAGAAGGRLVADMHAINWDEMDGATHIGLSAGASAPESLVHEIVDAMRSRYDLVLDENALVEETVTFKLPPVLTCQT